MRSYSPEQPINISNYININNNNSNALNVSRKSFLHRKPSFTIGICLFLAALSIARLRWSALCIVKISTSVRTASTHYSKQADRIADRIVVPHFHSHG